MPTKPKVLSVSYSELNSYRRCPHQWWLTYRERWQAPQVSGPLARGSLWHEIMAHHYQGKKIPAEFFHTDGDQNEAQALCGWLYDDYKLTYEDEDAGWQVLAVEQRVNHLLPPIDGIDRPVRLTGIIDLVVRENKRLWLVDHKTHKNMPNDRQLELEDQMPLYAWLLRRLGKPVHGIIYNVSRAFRWKDPLRTPEHKRFYLAFPDVHLDNVAREARLTVERMAQHGSRAMSERNTGDHCIYMCDYTESCIAGRRGINEIEFMRSKGFRREGK